MTAEADVVAAALKALRVGKAPGAALEHLEKHARLFPQGQLVREAAIARGEALLALGRSQDALAVLEHVARRGDRLDREVAVARAEIRAQLGRCAEARKDFDLVLAANVRDASDERALYGRGFCRLRSQDRDGARADLARYVEVYPRGRFAKAVRQALGESVGSPAAP